MQVLLGVGGSPLSYEALEEAIRRAGEAGDDLTVAVFGNDEVGAAHDEVDRRVRETLDDAGFEATIRHLEGDPGSEITTIAEREGFDRIVLGSGKRSALGKIQLGPIAEFVLLNAHTTVTLVR